MAFNTGNPLGSTDPRDFSDNSENLDRAVNNTASATWTDRLGNTRTSLAGQIGYIGTGAGGAIEDYAAGQELTTFSTIIRYSGEFYRPAAGVTLPYTTTATTPDVDANLVSVGDATLRQDLADNASLAGSDLVAHTGTTDTVTQALDKRTIYVGSVAEFEALSLPVGTAVYLTEDGRAGEFVVKTGTPPSDPQKGVYIVLSNGNYAERAEKRFLTPEMFGAVGDGVANDTAPWQEAERLSAGFVFGKFGATYLCDDTVNVTTPVQTDLNSSTVNFALSTTIPGFYAKANNVAFTNGAVNVTGTTMGGNAHSLACITSGVQSTGQGWKGLRVSGITASTNRSDAGATIAILGACNNFVIENITFPDNPDMAIGVGCEWGGNSSGTGHPHNGKIRNIKAGALTNSSTYPASNFVVWLSSCFNIEVSGVAADQCYGLIGCHAGDNGNRYAPASYAELVGTGISVDDIGCAKVTGECIRVTGRGSSALEDLPMSVNINGVRAVAFGAGTTYAFFGSQFDGPSVKNFYFEGFTNGFEVLAFSDNLTIESGKVTLCDNYGARMGANTGTSRWQKIKNVEFVNNNQSGETTTANAAILGRNTDGLSIENCVFGLSGGTETQKYSIALNTESVNTELNNNHTFDVAASGFAYVTGSSSETSKNVRGINNTADAGVSLLAGPPIFQIQADGTRHFVDDGIPTNGTFAVGDKVFFTAPSAAGWIGATCTTAGPVGTFVFKRFGQIEA